MATPKSTLPPQTPEEADEAHNPSRAEFLRDFENRPTTTDGIPEAEKISEDPKKNVKQAEENPADANEFDYNPSEPSRRRGSVSLNRKNSFKAGGIIGILLLVLGGFGLLLPLKIPGIMQMIADEAAQRVEQVTEKRAKVILGRAILSRVATNSGIVLTGDGAVSTLIASMRTNNFEKRLAAKGLVIENSGDGVKLKMNGQPLGGGKALKNELAIVRALEANKLSNKMLKDVIKEDIPSWRWMKKAKFAKWLRIKYGIPRYGVTNSDNPDPEERVNEMQKERLTSEYGGLADDIGNATECILTVDCEVDIDGEGRPDDMPESEDADAVGESADDAVDETVDSVVDDTNPSDGIRKTLLKTIVDKLGTKAIPIIGWIDLLATADHIAWAATEEDYFGKLASYYRTMQYARHYGLWSGYGSQIQLGAMDPEFISVLAEQTEGIEGAQAFQYIEGDSTKGAPANKIGYRQGDESGFARHLKELRSILAPGSNIPGVTQSTHFVLNLYYETIGGGGLLGWLSGKIGDFLAKLSAFITPDQFEEWFADIMAKVGGKLFEMMGLDFDPNIKGAEWFNATHGGATWTYNDFCKNEVGCRKLTAEQASIQNRSVAVDRAEYRSQQGLAYALFSQETSTSLTSQLAIHTPTGAADAVPSFARMIASTPSRLMGLITNKAFADEGYVDIHGIDPYGATAEELDQPVDPKALSGEPCEETFDGKELNLCQADTMVAEAMLCEFEPDSVDCSENDASNTEMTEGDGSLRIATFNILHTGGSDASEFESQWRTRMPTSIGVLKENGITVAGLQEVRPDQHDLLISQSYATDTYDIFPATSKGSAFTPNPIIWNKSTFKLVTGKTLPIEYDSGHKIDHATLVKLEDMSGNQFYVLNTHDPANARPGSDQENALSRLNNARYYTQYLGDLSKEGKPIFLTGDFNSAYTMGGGQPPYNNDPDNLTYCVVTRGGVLKNVWDILHKTPFNCPRNKSPSAPIDHIYAANISGVEKVWIAPDRTNGSDHPTVMAHIDLPWSTEQASGATVGSWAWPLGLPAFKAHRSAFLGSHYSGGGFLGDGSSSVDISWGEGDAGSPVYSMLDGVVKTQPLGRSSYRCVGTPNVDHNGGMLIESKINGKIVQIAYAHGANPTLSAGKSVKAGQQILKLGNVGNSCGAHLHMDMTYGGSNICLQDVFLSLEKKQAPNLELLVNKATATCAGRS